MKNKTNNQAQRIALLALLTALTAILSYFGGFIKIGGLASINLTLIPVVLGAALQGVWSGAWLGFVSGAVFFLTADAAYWMGLSVPGTIITVLMKGALAGLCAGLVYRLLAKKNRYLAVFVSAVVAPVVNTGLFLVGCLCFFMDTVTAGAAADGSSVFVYLMVVFVGLNFVFELLANVILGPTIVRLLNIRQKK